ncbi:MAG: MgtC/SapB family protein [Treponema sp.]|nr:MgtC/SapB family protein [Treponema sp.]
MELSFVIDCLVKLGASIICGFVLGIERKHRNQVMGMRTLILISVSSTLLSILSYYMAEMDVAKGFPGGDPTRIVAGVVSGIGFLGGGTILRQGMNIRGLTSAAIVWTASALGIAIGAGMYIQTVVVLIVVLLLLVFLEKVEERFFPAAKNKTLLVVFEDEAVDLAQLHDCIESFGLIISDMSASYTAANHQTVMKYYIKSPSEIDFLKLRTQVQVIAPVIEFALTE